MADEKDLQCMGCERWFRTKKAVVPDHQGPAKTGKCVGSGRKPKRVE
jgi:hypothetical protein